MQILARDYDPNVKYVVASGRPEIGMVEKVEYKREIKGEFVQLSGMFLENLYNRIYAYPHIQGKYTLRGLLERITSSSWYKLDLYSFTIPQTPFDDIEVDVSWKNETITDSLYATLKTLEMSWGIVYDTEAKSLAIRLWKGKDRTQSQAENSFASFTDESYHVNNFSFVEDESGYRNHAVVFYGSDSAGDPYRHDVYTENWETEGRRWIMMNVDDNLTEQERTQKAHEELAKNHSIVQSAVVDVKQDGLVYLQDYDLGDYCDIACHKLGKAFSTRLTGSNEVFKAGQHDVSLTFGERSTSQYQRVARYGRGYVRGREIPQITSQRVYIDLPDIGWQRVTINSLKRGTN